MNSQDHVTPEYMNIKQTFNNYEKFIYCIVHELDLMSDQWAAQNNYEHIQEMGCWYVTREWFLNLLSNQVRTDDCFLLSEKRNIPMCY